MRAALAEFLELVRMDLQRLGRTEAVFWFACAPALLLLPIGAALGGLAASMQGPAGVVAIPADLPKEIDLQRLLEEQGLLVQIDDDPAGAFYMGEVDAAVLSWQEGTGLASAGSAELATPEAWTLSLETNSKELGDHVRTVAAKAGEAFVSDLVVLAGGSIPRDLEVARVRTVKNPRPQLFEPRRFMPAYLGLLGSLFAFFFLSLPSVADRGEGLLETLAVMPVSLVRLLQARVAAVLVVQVVCGLLFLGSLALILGSPARWPEVFDLQVALVPGLAASVILGNALFAALGMLSANTRAANNYSIIATGLYTGLLAWGLFGEAPVWVPTAGTILATEAWAYALSTASTLAAAVLVLELTGRLVSSRVDLILPQRER